MIDSLLDRASSVLERRFLTNAFLPVLLLLPAAALPSLLEQRQLEQMINSFSPQPLTTKALLAGGYFTFSWFAAAVVASQWRNIIRLFEGYPLARWPALDELGKRWHRIRLAAVDDDEDEWFARYLDYPAGPDVLPTRLGNVMRAAELYPLYRYDAELILVWPRLRQVLPQESIRDVEEARGTLEFLLVLSLWFSSFALLAPCISGLAGGSAPVALTCFALGGGGAYASYLSGVAAATEYGENLRSLFDTHRLTLLQQLRLPLPTSHDVERERWRDLAAFIGRGVPLHGDYDHGVANPMHSWPGIGSSGAPE
jgi:hypothetical protein